MHSSVSYLGIWVRRLGIHVYTCPSIISDCIELLRAKWVKKKMRVR